LSEPHQLESWLDKLEIREVIERSVRYTDDRAPDLLAELFDEDGVLQLAGTVFHGRKAFREMFGGNGNPPRWTDEGELLKQPASSHLTSNPVIDINGDVAVAETDMVTLMRDDQGRARITLLARYRDRLRRTEGGGWLITNRTGVSIGRPGDEGTDSEWARALAAMPEDVRARFRTDR
jgi:hypothetical protein